MEKEFFIADTHFWDENIIRYENRPFESVEIMNSEVMRLWNSCVNKDDTVYLLGDFSKGTEEQDKEILEKLNGRKILVMGNHDTHRTADEWRKIGFSQAVEWPIIYHGFFILSREPIYINNNMPYANIYGHVHSNPSYCNVSKQSICISAERIDYTPISFEQIVDRIKKCN